MNPNITVQEIMTANPVTVQPNSTLGEVRELFSRNSFHHVPVTKQSGELVGIISREDFFKVAYVLSVEATRSSETKSRFQHLLAEDIMTKYPLQLSAEDTVGLAADIFLANKFHALPIVDDGQLVGIITAHDLLAYSFSSPIGEQLELENYDEG
ncbi:MAG: CBS domain-containing protein [Saprospiraceae bacterium]|nr:CBS domain-containing protein [Saprospiraceae bacterium]MCF8252001.1 CBS domain-containing protein [Saprospiraceae bacterium]MCF8281664.1 CBS domain-containing protein [Bacteroidales bacterium]MCF8313652.1 CBS domain-containing protein [Saprospiraceae bacterium]MCF8442359.1 CBS domain-containing protein [Saprospiraceae bacterium]